MAAAVPFLRGGNLNLVVQAAPSYWTGYTSNAMPGWAALNSDTRRFAVAFLFNSLKARHLGARKPAWMDSTERIRLISYLEAILEPTCPLIIGSCPAAAPGAAIALPAATEVDPAAPAGTPFQDQLVMTYRAGGAAATWAGDVTTVTLPQALAAQAEHYMSAQFTFVLALAKKGDRTRQFSAKATRGLQLELGLSNLEIYSDEVAWIATRVINSASLPTEAAWANLQHPNFDWVAVDRAFPGELQHAQTTHTVLATEPYRVFHHPNPAGPWQPTAFQNASHVAFLLLQACGDVSLASSAGFRNHNLLGLATWQGHCAAYATANANARLGAVDVTATAAHPVAGVIL
ncbi:hypothetical protein HELRODRAFT_176053 [Helobdella robusta]|uniref:Uncharacterized protein n=1 Tax=Helobdella robusta TaxID=6412 RepID=T1FA32_HELRO|nr:hypothetical protein HELRODRAFT_176053 [Helobdella robusta]ESO00213.1 hypothetical protein HELRODRAFT_176053 [Helobdella robusta]